MLSFLIITAILDIVSTIITISTIVISIIIIVIIINGNKKVQRYYYYANDIMFYIFTRKGRSSNCATLLLDLLLDLAKVFYFCKRILYTILN